MIRTKSITNTDEFGPSICAFANGFSNHQLLGDLLLSLGGDGKVKGNTVTDGLLKKMAAIPTDRNLQLQPSMTVEESDIVMVKVEPLCFLSSDTRIALGFE